MKPATVPPGVGRGQRAFLVSRRHFLHAVAGCFLVRPAVVGRAAQSPPSGRLNLACVGVGGRGADNLASLRGQNIVALCDVDEARAAASVKAFPGARFFRDWRRLLDAVGNEIDAVVVSTPDHTHAVVASAAMDLGKHVYCEKPLAHSLHEVRYLTEKARRKNLATQLGNQGHSSESIREFVEMIRSGAIGVVREVHAFVGNSYRPRNYTVRPAERPPVPPTLDWDLWLGPAPERPYHPVYLPGKWRGWVDFGTGITGDWVCHVLDPIYWALELDAPSAVRAEAVDYDDAGVRAETFPAGAKITFEFPARGNRAPLKIVWHEGSVAPPRPAELEEKRQLPGIGAIIIGDQGKVLHGSHGAAGAQLLPRARWDAYQRPPKTLPRSKGHYEDWVAACQGGAPATSNFNYGGPLTEVALLGVAALRFNGERLEWDSAALRFKNHDAANALINPPCRGGWKLA
ncbi:MAG: Gfo/Idh/MocA family oxidoreductase [Verrucomicrobia bacterium]|nr:Gfo/Idh/MocA family oxidoreductase [Verrucomicrobiota bacterium]